MTTQTNPEGRANRDPENNHPDNTQPMSPPAVFNLTDILLIDNVANISVGYALGVVQSYLERLYVPPFAQKERREMVGLLIDVYNTLDLYEYEGVDHD